MDKNDSLNYYFHGKTNNCSYIFDAHYLSQNLDSLNLLKHTFL